MNTFSTFFKTYRLRAEFVSYSAFANALAQKGYIYESSIFSHWQKGTRIPTNRHLLLKMIEIFIERKAIQTLHEANEFLASTGLGYLTNHESQTLFHTHSIGSMT